MMLELTKIPYICQDFFLTILFKQHVNKNQKLCFTQKYIEVTLINYFTIKLNT